MAVSLRSSLLALVAVIALCGHAASAQTLHNISVSNVPDVNILASYFGTNYGGGFSSNINVHIKQLPSSSIVVRMVPQAGVEMHPPQLSFNSTDTSKTQQVYFRARYRGIFTLAFAVSGPSASEFLSTITSRRWRVFGGNQRCISTLTQTACWQRSGCVWNPLISTTKKCSNQTLPVQISTIPRLYSTEPTVSLTITLPVAVRGDNLTITFREVLTSASVLTFNPTNVTIPKGGTTASFTITGITNSAILKRPFRLALSGDRNINIYTQEVRDVYLHPQKRCTVSAPKVWFVGHGSDWFNVTCNDGGPENQVVLLINPVYGIDFQAETVDPLYPAGSLVFNAGETFKRFRAFANGSTFYTFNTTFNVTGTNAPRFAPVPLFFFRVIPLGRVALPPSFYITQFDTSENLHLDLTIPTSHALTVTVFIEHDNGTDASGTNDMLPGNNLIFLPGKSRRMTFNISAEAIGTFYLRFSLTGASVANFVPPTDRVLFRVRDPASGKAFESRLHLGFMSNRRRCRVSTGWSSVRFKGQAPVGRSDLFCQRTAQVLPNATHNCSQWPSELSCRLVLERRGHACAWHEDQCRFLPQIQGQIDSYSHGSGFTVFLLKNYSVWTIGSTRYGQLGHYQNTLAWVNISETIATVQAGTNHIVALSHQGNVYSWGANGEGQLGTDSRDQHSAIPTLVRFPIPRQNITCITAGTLHTMALSLSGFLFAWGSNGYGQLGMSQQFRDHLRRPLRVDVGKFDGPIIAVQAGEYHTMAATIDTAYTWGSNTMGQLGRDGYNRTGNGWQDEYEPQTTELFVPKPFVTPPTWPGHLLGRDC